MIFFLKRFPISPPDYFYLFDSSYINSIVQILPSITNAVVEYLNRLWSSPSFGASHSNPIVNVISDISSNPTVNNPIVFIIFCIILFLVVNFVNSVVRTGFEPV